MKLKNLSSSGRRWLAIVAAAIVVLLIALSMLSSFYIDLLWFREVDYTSVFWTTLRTKVLLGLVFGLLFFALLYANLLIVRRSNPGGPTLRIATPEQEAFERLRHLAEPYLKWVIPVGCAVLALIVGINAASQWSTYLVWRNGAGLSFGNPEPLFNRDPAFYIFSLPWLHFLQSWLFSSLLGVTVLAGMAHFAWGGIQPTAPAFADKATPLVRAHLSVLLGITLLTRAWGYYLNRFDLLGSDRGVVQGASYTDVRAQLPALNVLTLVAIICAVLFLVNIRLRRWSLPVIAVGLLAAVSILLGRAYPAFVQQFSVKPQELQRETAYIEANIAGTRQAFGLNKIEVSQRAAEPRVTAAEIDDNDATISNIRLWRPSVIQENFQSLQRIRQYYEFADVDVDRYPINGERRVLMISGREVSQNGIPTGGKTWQNTHLVYTHGYGAVAAAVNSASPEGAPELILRDIPPVGEPTITEPRIYYGEKSDVPFVVTNTDAAEIDYEGAEPTTYTGTGGIPLGNRVQRALFAWRYNDLNLLISGLINDKSRIMLYPEIGDRVPKAAPFLTYDADPYLAVVDGRLTWIYDAYTTSNNYPYSQSINLSAATNVPLGGDVNYIRNSVKVTVDAYNGQMTYFLVDPTDPIAVAWSKAYPGLLLPDTAASPDLQAHFRYPENLFQVQAAQFASYHVESPSVFFQKQDVWAIPVDPTIQANEPTLTGPMRPYYVLMRLPGDTEEHFQLILPFTPEGRQNMTSWLAADSDPGSYGRLTAFVFPQGRNIDGPTQVFAQINQDPNFSEFRTLQGQQGSGVVFGDFLVIPVGDSLLYVAPVYVRSNQDSSIPELKRVVVVNGGSVGVGTNLTQALAASIGEEPPPDNTTDGTDTGGDTGTPGTGTIDEQVTSLLDQALEHFATADLALKSGDLATYQTELAAAEALVEQASVLAAGTTPTTTGGASSTTDGSTTSSSTNDSSPVGGTTTTASTTGASTTSGTGTS